MRSYSREQKLITLRWWETSGKSMAEVEREMWISARCISHWRKELARDGEQAFPGCGWLTTDGYYAWRKRRAQERTARAEVLQGSTPDKSTAL